MVASAYRLVLLALAVLTLVSCERAVLTDGEWQAKRKFEQITPGIIEQELLRRLGTPTGVFLPNSQGKAIKYLMREGRHPIEFDYASRGSGDLPQEVRFLPERATRKVVVYVSGTIFAYYFFDDADRVEQVKIIVS